MIMKKEDTFKILDPTQRPVEKDESELPGELLNGWHSIFAHLQSVVQAKPTDLFGQLLDQSRLYRGQLHAHLAQMQDRMDECHSASPELGKLSLQFEIIAIAHSIWMLSETIHVNPNQSIADSLGEWIRLETFRIDRNPPVRMDGGHPVLVGVEADSDHYWQWVHRLIMHGRTEMATRMLLANPKLGRALKELIHTRLTPLLTRLPYFSSSFSSSENDLAAFVARFSEWRSRVADVFKGRADNARINRLVDVLSGKTSALTAAASDWKELFVGYLLLRAPDARKADLADLALRCFKQKNEQKSPTPFSADDLILRVFRGDVLSVLAQWNGLMGARWVSAHLADLLLHCQAFEDRRVASSQVPVREHFLLEYSETLFGSSLWQLAPSYLAQCEQRGPACMAQLVETVPITSERVIHKLLSLCTVWNMGSSRRRIIQRAAAHHWSALPRPRAGSAVRWFLKADDGKGAREVCVEVVRRFLAKESGALQMLDEIVANVSPADSMSLKELTCVFSLHGYAQLRADIHRLRRALERVTEGDSRVEPPPKRSKMEVEEREEETGEIETEGEAAMLMRKIRLARYAALSVLHDLVVKEVAPRQSWPSLCAEAAALMTDTMHDLSEQCDLEATNVPSSGYMLTAKQASDLLIKLVDFDLLNKNYPMETFGKKIDLKATHLTMTRYLAAVYVS
eukprot:655_1